MAYLPCLNPNCKSHGAPHPNCKCYDNLSGKEMRHFKAENRLLKASGEEENQLPGTYKKQKRGVAANSLGILGNDIGSGYAHGGEVHFCDSGMSHHPDCEYYAEGGEVEQNQEFHLNPELAVDKAIANHGLFHLLTKTGISKSEDPYRPIQELMDHSRKGHKKSESHVNGVFDKQMPDDDMAANTDALKSHIDMLQMNPEAVLDVGGTINEHLPTHSGLIAAKAANVSNYLNGIKPMGSQLGTLDKITPPSKHIENEYNRQVGIAENPLSIVKRIKNGTASPSDVKTLQTLYPQLSKFLTDKLFEKVADAKGSGRLLSMRQKSGISSIMGPLSSSQTTMAMQAIIHSAAGGEPPAPHKGPTAQTQKTIEKADKMYQSPLDKLQIEKKV